MSNRYIHVNKDTVIGITFVQYPKSVNHHLSHGISNELATFYMHTKKPNVDVHMRAKTAKLIITHKQVCWGGGGGGGVECLYKKISVLHSRTKKIAKLSFGQRY